MDKESKEVQRLESERTPQHVLNTILSLIGKVKEEQWLEFTLSIEDAYLIIESLQSDADFESRRP